MAKPALPTFVQALVIHLMEPERARLDKTLATIIKSNFQLGGSEKAFLYLGRVYNQEPIAKIRGDKIKPLHSSLAGEIEYFLGQEKTFAGGAQRLRQGLSVVTGKCQTSQDFRNALPDILVKDVPALRGISRTEPEGALLDANPRLREQFQTTVNLALDFAANRFLY